MANMIDGTENLRKAALLVIHAYRCPGVSFDTMESLIDLLARQAGAAATPFRLDENLQRSPMAADVFHFPAVGEADSWAEVQIKNPAFRPVD